jgi:mycobactin salicyl-AMP ligase
VARIAVEGHDESSFAFAVGKKTGLPMIAPAPARSGSVPSEASEAKLPDCVGISDLLRMNANLSPDKAAFVDQMGREEWSGRHAACQTFAAANNLSSRLSAFFLSLGLPERALVGVSLPNGSEAAAVLVALDRAGLTACLLPVAWSRDTLAAVTEDLAIACIVTQSRIGPLCPAETWREIAAGYFGLRFILSFGPSVPDGVIDLDRMIPDVAPEGCPEAEPRPRTDSGYISFDNRDGVLTPHFRTWNSSLAAARVFLAAAGYEPSDRIVSLLAQDDHRSLTTGLTAALLSCASVEFHGLFCGNALLHSLAAEGPMRIVAPGWMEADLARLELGPSVRGIVLVHKAPVRFKARAPLTFGVVDALAFGELALLAKPRTSRGQFALSLDAPVIGNPASQSQLLDVRRDEEGQIQFRGLAASTAVVTRDAIGAVPEGWQASGYTAEVFAGIVIGVS